MRMSEERLNEIANLIGERVLFKEIYRELLACWTDISELKKNHQSCIDMLKSADAIMDEKMKEIAQLRSELEKTKEEVESKTELLTSIAKLLGSLITNTP